MNGRWHCWRVQIALGSGLQFQQLGVVACQAQCGLQQWQCAIGMAVVDVLDRCVTQAHCSCPTQLQCAFVAWRQDQYGVGQVFYVVVGCVVDESFGAIRFLRAGQQRSDLRFTTL